VKDLVIRLKRQARDWKKIFENHIYNKRLLCRICTEFSNIDNEKPKIIKQENEQKT
jgi:hypothetical protein